MYVLVLRRRIFRVVFREYHQHLSYMLDCMGACAEQLANSDILKVGGGGPPREVLLPCVRFLLDSHW